MKYRIDKKIFPTKGFSFIVSHCQPRYTESIPVIKGIILPNKPLEPKCSFLFVTLPNDSDVGNNVIFLPDQYMTK